MPKVIRPSSALVLADRQRFHIRSRSGFTLIELLVVLAIMGSLAGAIIANYSGQRSARNLRIATNELVTNIRKVRSYALSSRELNGSTPVDYYLLRFDTAHPHQYLIEAMYNVKSSPAQVRDVQTIYMSSDISLAAPSVNGTPNASGCDLLAFVLPFAQILTNTSCVGGPPTTTSGDDYDNIITFVANSSGTVSSDSKTVITLQTQFNGLSRKVLVNGTTGVVCPTSDGNTCVANY